LHLFFLSKRLSLFLFLGLDLSDCAFALLTPSPEWARAAAVAAQELRVPLNACCVGSEELLELEEEKGDFCKAYGIQENGVVLVRPDGHIAWRSAQGIGVTTTSTPGPGGGQDEASEIRRVLEADPPLEWLRDRLRT